MNQIFTVGHSTQTIESFTALLERHHIDVVADVRSHPVSSRFPHFSKEALEQKLKAAAIGYVFLGRELGARRDEPECYINGQAAYAAIARLPAFSEGIRRVLSGALSYRIALMCAEQDPLTCHRTILVGHALKRHGVSLQHIRRSGAIETQSEAEERLITEELGRSDQPDLFAGRWSPEHVLEQAYDQRAHAIAYTRPERLDPYSHDRTHSKIR